MSPSVILVNLSVSREKTLDVQFFDPLAKRANPFRWITILQWLPISYWTPTQGELKASMNFANLSAD